MKRLIIIAVVLCAAAVAGYVYWYRSPTSNPITAYHTEPVTRGDIVRQVTASGTLEPVNQVTVGAQITGTIAKMHADFNSIVTKDQVIAEIDPAFLLAQKQESEANLVKARASAEQAERDYQRATSLFERKLLSDQELDSARTSAEVARASVTQAKAARDRTETNLKYATIRSPIDGIVVSRKVEVGQTVAASLSAPELFVIAEDLSRMQVITPIDESDIGLVKQGQSVSFSVDAFPTEQFDGIVKTIRLASTLEQNVVTYPVVIEVSNPDQKLMPGMTANVTITVSEARDVLRLPSAALRFTPKSRDETASRNGESKTAGTAKAASNRADASIPAGTKKDNPDRNGRKLPTVYILENDQPKAITVSVGIEDGAYTHLTGSELSEGNEVITGTVRSSSTTKQSSSSPFGMGMRPPR